MQLIRFYKPPVNTAEALMINVMILFGLC